jgi:hypothetical protein
MSKPMVLSQEAWAKIYNKIAKEYPPSVLLVRTKMRSVLGFTSRTHTVWRHDVGGSYPLEFIHLDFYDEPKRTMFVLKYSEYLDKSGKIDLRDS